LAATAMRMGSPAQTGAATSKYKKTIVRIEKPQKMQL
jgi:hypothetical protein